MKVIVGLGNPGKEYRDSRHNTGFLVIDRLSHVFQVPVERREFKSLLGTGTINGEEAILAKPSTFVNLSGIAVKELMDSYSVALKDLIVIHDDLDLGFGRIKIKQWGGNGGHKGIRSIITALGSDEFVRVRIGIGRPFPPADATEYVLGSFAGENKVVLEEVISCAQKTVEVILKEGVQAAMNQFHGPAEDGPL